MKRTFALLTLLLALCLGGCSASNQSYYEHAQLMLGYGDYEAAAELFMQLGEYRDSADYALYSTALSALKEGEKELARTNFALLGDFKSSRRYLRYVDALMLEDKGELEAALEIFDALGSFENSRSQAQGLREKIPSDALSQAKALMAAGKYEQARGILAKLHGYGDSTLLMAQCDQALLEDAYQQAEALYAGGEYARAQSAFEALGDNLDAAKRAMECRDAMYSDLEENYRAVSLSTVEEVMAGYQAMAGFGESQARLNELHNRFDKTLALRDNAVTGPYVLWGKYPFGESGMPQPLLWRVLDVQDHEARLLCETVIDAVQVASGTDLILSPAEEAHIVSVSVPNRDDLSGLGEEDLEAVATPYALAQGVRHHSDGRAWWWLGDEVEQGRSAIVWYNGVILDSGVANTETVVGLRPLMRLDLEMLEFTAGDGTRENPYR